MPLFITSLGEIVAFLQKATEGQEVEEADAIIVSTVETMMKEALLRLPNGSECHN